MIIKKGDKFKCIRDVIMNDDPEEIAYTSDKIYISEVDECITDNQGLVYHHWNSKEDNQYFIVSSVYFPSNAFFAKRNIFDGL